MILNPVLKKNLHKNKKYGENRLLMIKDSFSIKIGGKFDDFVIIESFSQIHFWFYHIDNSLNGQRKLIEIKIKF